MYRKSFPIISILRKFEARLGFVDILPLELFSIVRFYMKFKPDVIHFHDLSSAVSPITLKILAKFVPVVFTMHDVSPVTGGCLYPLNCETFSTGCGSCPQLGLWPLVTRRDRTKWLKKVRLKVLFSQNLFLITPSKWLANVVEDQLEHKKKITVISNGVTKSSISPVLINPEDFIINDLNLAYKTPTILLNYSDTNDERKGFQQSVEILNLLHDKGAEFQIIVLGSAGTPSLLRLPKVPIFVAGYISSKTEKMKLVSASDALLFTSKADNQPLTVLEALVEGLVVFGFEVGGLTEMNGLVDGIMLSKLNDVDDVVTKLNDFFLNQDLLERKVERGAKAEVIFGEYQFLKKHISHYTKVLNED